MSASLSGRIDDFYKTLLGNQRPHAGGHWLKTLCSRACRPTAATMSVRWTRADQHLSRLLAPEQLDTLVAFFRHKVEDARTGEARGTWAVCSDHVTQRNTLRCLVVNVMATLLTGGRG